MTTSNPSPLGRHDTATVRVWDLPTRCFHWALVLCFVGAVVTAKVGGNAMVWHMRLGLAVGALVVFRLVWGVIGGRWSRFSSFVRGPAAVLRYLRGGSVAGDHAEVGHNPLGSLSVLAVLALLLTQVASGTVADDEIASTGPLFAMVSEAASHLATRWHRTVGQYGLYGLVALHVGAILFYRLRRGKDLITPMVRGDKVLPASTPASSDGWPQRVLALLVFGVCGAAAVWLARLGG